MIWGGVTLQFVPSSNGGNVFAFGPDLEPAPAYLRPPGPLTRLAPALKATEDPAERARLTEALKAVRGSEGARWGDPDVVRTASARERASLATRHLAAGDRVLDLGAGGLYLRAVLPEGAAYTPVDLVPFAADTVVCDLNRGPFPDGHWDVVVALELCAYIHDVPTLLDGCAAAASRLLVSYRGRAGEPIVQRRQEGWFNDYTEAEFRALLGAAGWAIDGTDAGVGTTLFVCSRR